VLDEEISKRNIEVDPASRRIAMVREAMEGDPNQHAIMGVAASVHSAHPRMDVDKHLHNLRTIIKRLVKCEAKRVSFNREALLGVLQDLLVLIHSNGDEHYLIKTDLELTQVCYSGTIDNHSLLHHGQSEYEHLKETIIHRLVEALAEHIEIIEMDDPSLNCRRIHAQVFVAKRNT